MPIDVPHLISMPDLTWRPAVESDVEGIVALQDACFEVDQTYREVASEIAERWGNPMMDPAADSLLAVQPDGTIVTSVWSIAPTTADTKWRAFEDNYIHPNHRTHEMYAAAFGWWEARSSERLAAHDDGLGTVLRVGAYEQEQGKIAFLESSGYEVVRFHDELIRNLSEPIDPVVLPESMKFVLAHESREGDELAVHNAAFSDHWGSQSFSQEAWDHFKGEFHEADASWVVYDGELPVGHILCSTFPHDFEDRGFTHSWIESLGVVRSHRGRGLATAMVTAAMQQFAGAGMEYAVLDVDSENPSGAFRIYEALGFVHARRTLTLMKDAQTDV